VSLLEIRNLRTHLQTREGVARAVDGVDLTLEEGESVGLVGESGSGKSILVLSILGLLPERQAMIQPGSSIRWRGEELVGMNAGRLREVRGGEIAMIFQEPSTSLNPVLTIGDQILESVCLHRGLKGKAARREVLRLLDEAGLPDPPGRFGDYPHQFSGGMRQRAMIAMALAGSPSLLLADEPTTALDVTVQAQILRLLEGVRERFGMTLLLVSHDLAVVARICRRVVVMYGGRVVEAGETRAVLEHPRHPYTRGLVGSRLSLTGSRQGLRPIPGEVPEATAWPPACRFHPRCGEVVPRCREAEPGLFTASPAEHGTQGGSLSTKKKGGLNKGAPKKDACRKVRCWLVEGSEEVEEGEK
jgi:oligopeptide/dipeptide ABC transporter ATP-binding protein